MKFHATTKIDDNYTLLLMPRLSCYSKIMNSRGNLYYNSCYYNSWKNYLKENDNILYVRPVKRAHTFLNDNNTCSLNMYYKVLYHPDKLAKVNLRSRLHLFLKYY